MLLVTSQLAAQSSSTLMGARAMGVAYASSCLEDEWSLFNNPAGISSVKQTSTAFTYKVHPSLKSFNSMAGVFTLPLKFGVTGLGVYRFGDELYNEHVISAAFANQFGLASLGVKVNYIQYQGEGFGTTGMVTVSLGGIARFSDKFLVGAHILNINQPKVTSEDRDETVPAILIAGLAWKPSAKLLLTTEIEKDIDYPLLWKTGIEYQAHSKVSLRTGYRIEPSAAFFGLGLKPKKFTIDYAFEYNFQLGASHQASVGYKFQSK
jgi:hypothetical protein